jgi:hypothetical protein
MWIRKTTNSHCPTGNFLVVVVVVGIGTDAGN